jgi:hypothetical protein
MVEEDGEGNEEGAPRGIPMTGTLLKDNSSLEIGEDLEDNAG